MYKMIIVDDEPLIRSGLKNLIEWEVYGIEIAAEADDGLTAYRTIKELSPDIALIDINMPHMSGIELIELCSHLEHTPKFIILSGYNDFEYVRSAMRHGAVNYLLKPVDQEELCSTVKSAVRILDDARNQKQQYAESLQTFRNDILVRILTNRIDIREVREKCRFAGLNFHCSHMRLGLLWPVYTNQQGEKRADLTAAQLCERICSATCGCYAALDTADHIILIFKDTAHVLSQRDYEELLAGCARHLRERLSLSFITALSGALSNTAEFPGAYIACTQTAEHKEILQGFFQKETLRKLEKDSPAFFSYDDVVHCLEIQDKENLKKILHRYFTEALSNDESGDIESLKYRLIEFIIYTMEKLKSSQLPNADIVLQKKEAFQLIGKLHSLSELEERMFLFLTALMDKLNENTDSACSGLVQNALHYVQNNYQDKELSLKTLACRLNVNAAYLGRQFSLETNEYFSDYVNRLRIARAISLLESSGWKTAAIAEAVGFSNISYFFTVFKKITGGRPGDYRKNPNRNPEL